MGQKVDPRGLRLGVNRDWQSKWYAEKGNYVNNLNHDIKIREYLVKELKDAAVSEILIERKNNKVDKKLIISCLLIFISVVIVFNNSKILKNLDISIKVQERQNEIDKELLQIPDSDKTKDSFLYILMNKYGKAILSDRDIYFNYTYKIYNDNFDINTLLFGIGYSNNKKINNIAITKLIEIDFFDI